MSYIGNTPAENFASFLTETFSVSATANYTLSHAVANENDIRLVINGVVQQPGSGKAYTASGTTLTLTSATASGDVMYAVYLGRALQTVNAPNASVGSDQTAPTIITGQTELATAPDSTDELLISDAGVLKRVDVSLIGGANTPYCYGELQNSQTVSRGVFTKLTGMTLNEIDTNSAFDGTTFTVPSGSNGNYFVMGNIQASFSSIGNDGEQVRAGIYKNGSLLKQAVYYDQSTDSREVNIKVSAVISLVATNTIELYARVWDGDASGSASLSDSTNSLTIFRLI